MITIHWSTLYAIVAWTWAATCWAYEQDFNHYSVSESIVVTLMAPLYFPFAILVVIVEVIAEFARSRRNP